MLPGPRPPKEPSTRFRSASSDSGSVPPEAAVVLVTALIAVGAINLLASLADVFPTLIGLRDQSAGSGEHEQSQQHGASSEVEGEGMAVMSGDDTGDPGCEAAADEQHQNCEDENAAGRIGRKGMH
mgnify:CR=1 FL=1